MEEYADETCSIVYLCANAQDDIYALYHKGSPPEEAAAAVKERSPLDRTHDNVRTLLDEDQGGFDEVFLTSRQDQCLERLDNYGNHHSTIVLIELRNTSDELHDKGKGPYPFLRALCTDIEGARFQKHVMPFVVITFDDSLSTEMDTTLTTNCLMTGAIEVLRSPLLHDDINRIVGHVKETIRPPARLIGSHMTQNLVNSIRDTAKPPRIACHRPDEVISSDRKAAIEEAVRQWHFPAHEFDMDELTYGALHMLESVLRNPELEAYALPRAQLISFLLATRRQYKHDREVHYHNWRHAVDVTQSLYCFLVDVRICPPIDSDEGEQKALNDVENMLTPLDGLILIVSAIGHDVGHPGVNNAFLVACNHPLAQTYNDKSVLENYHCAAYSQLLRRHWGSLYNIAGFRATMISTILATDMQRHFEYMGSLGELKAKVESSEPPVNEWGTKERETTRELLMALLMKAADISNVARPFEVSAKWAKILMTEFARQGELEAELDIPTCLFGGPPKKDDVLGAAQSQKGFMSLFGFPLFSGIADIMPSVSCSIRELNNNKEVWDQKIEEEKQRRDSDAAKEQPHFSSVTENEVKEAQAEQHHNSEPNAVPAQLAQVPSTPTKRAVVTGVETSPSKHAANDLRQQVVQGITFEDDKRSSMPFLSSPGTAVSSPGSPSRRSSKDIALDQMHQLNALAQQANNSGSRRGSADASWQIHQSYPNSRRGSKDESLTTIVFTSGGTPNRRASPSSPDKRGSPSKSINKYQNSTNQRQVGGRNSVPSSRSNTTSTATANTTQQSPGTTQPSSLAAEDDEAMRSAVLPSIPSTEDPFVSPGHWPDDLDGQHRTSQPNVGLPSTPPTPPPLDITKSQSPPVVTPVASGEDEARGTPRKTGEHGIRESRSRSRLRGLKFWKRKKEAVGPEGAPVPDSPTP